MPAPLTAGVITGVVIGLVTGSWMWAIIALVAAAAVAAAALYLAADWITARLLGARPLHEGGSEIIRNQLEELCARTGVAEPELFTVGPGAAAIASFGRDRPALVVTDGLSDELGVVELEAAVARELARANSGATTVDTLAVAFLTAPFGWLGGLGNRMLDWFRGGDHDAKVDLDGVAITRYPPGLHQALAKMKRPASQSGAVAHLWATGTEVGGKAIGHFSFEERLEMLAEL